MQASLALGCSRQLAEQSESHGALRFRQPQGKIASLSQGESSSRPATIVSRHLRAESVHTRVFIDVERCRRIEPHERRAQDADDYYRSMNSFASNVPMQI